MSVPKTLDQIQWLKANRVLPKCPRCGRIVSLTREAGQRLHRCCGLTSYPFAPLVDDETQTLRARGHRHLDAAWSNRRVGRSKCYQILAQMTGIPEEQCHFSVLTGDQLRKAVRAARIIGDPKRFKKWRNNAASSGELK